MANNNDSQSFSDYSNFSQADEFYREVVLNQRLNNAFNDPFDSTPPPSIPSQERLLEDLRQNQNHLTPSTSFHSEPASFHNSPSYQREDFYTNAYNNHSDNSQASANRNGVYYPFGNSPTSNVDYNHSQYTDSYRNPFSLSCPDSNSTPYHNSNTYDHYRDWNNNFSISSSQCFSNSSTYHFSDLDNNEQKGNRNSLMSRSSSFELEPDLKPAYARTNEDIYEYDSIPCTQPSLVRYGEYLASLNETKSTEKQDEYY